MSPFVPRALIGRAGDAGGFAAMEAHLRRVAALVPGAWVGPAGDA